MIMLLATNRIRSEMLVTSAIYVCDTAKDLSKYFENVASTEDQMNGYLKI